MGTKFPPSVNSGPIFEITSTRLTRVELI